MQDLTVVLIVSERQWTLQRRLTYCEDAQSDLLVVDASEHPWPSSAAFRHAQFLHLPGLNACRALARALEGVTTQYVAWGAASDFFLTSGLRESTAFLERHPDHSAAGGRRLWFSDGPAVCSHAPCGSLDADRSVRLGPTGDVPEARVAEMLFRPGLASPGVVRSEVLRRACSLALEHPVLQLPQCFDLTLALTVAAMGKHADLPVVSVLEDRSPGPAKPLATGPWQEVGPILPLLADRLGPLASALREVPRGDDRSHSGRRSARPSSDRAGKPDEAPPSLSEEEQLEIERILGLVQCYPDPALGRARGRGAGRRSGPCQGRTGLLPRSSAALQA